MITETAVFRDNLLIRISHALQLTDTQFQAAERSYLAVGAWLADDDLLSIVHPRIYPQGSMALLTTVKPRGQVEYDLDMVLEIDGIDGLTPKWLYQAVHARLATHEFYRKILKPRPRCLRLDYANQFHLDIVAARSHVRIGSPFIEVPQAPEADGELHSWITSNPKGFAGWFKQQCEKRSARYLVEKSQEPLPVPVVANHKPVLALAVQLLKRHRDVVFGASPDAPSSIVLTTLAGTFYQGEASLGVALLQILESAAKLTSIDPRLSSLSNPSCADERLCSGWSSRKCEAFARFVSNFREKLEEVTVTQGIDHIAAKLRLLFGDETLAKNDVVTKAIIEYVHERMTAARNSGTLSFAKAGGLSTTAGVGIAVPRHTFYGRKVRK